MKFKLEIELGNDAARTYRDVVRLLAEAADGIKNSRNGEVVHTDGGRTFRDINGNTVGWWRVER